MTTDFAFYQYFVRLEDDDAQLMLELLTDHSGPVSGNAQATLGKSVLGMVRGEEAVARALRLTSLLFDAPGVGGQAFVPQDIVAAANEADQPPAVVQLDMPVANAASKVRKLGR